MEPRVHEGNIAQVEVDDATQILDGVLALANWAKQDQTLEPIAFHWSYNAGNHHYDVSLVFQRHDRW